MTNFTPVRLAVVVMICVVAGVLLLETSAFTVHQVMQPRSKSSSSVRAQSQRLLRSLLSLSASSPVPQHDNNTNDGNQKSKSSQANKKHQDHPMAKTSRFSHVMLKVPSVDKAVDYWIEQGGKVVISREDPNATNGQAGRLLSAFVEMGSSNNNNKSKENLNDQSSSSSSTKKAFALELVSMGDQKQFELGTSISYIGLSLLLQFQNNLLGVITGSDKPPKAPKPEPNGIPVQYCASAPGDYLCRLALKSNNLPATLEFYTTVLGMDAKAQDETMICLRYDNNNDTPSEGSSSSSSSSGSSSGVPTTLLFDATPTMTTTTTTTTAANEDDTTSNKIIKGNCLDHIAIGTSASIEEQYERIKSLGTCSIFMNPTEMFGQTVMGVIDPNGYKVVLASGG
jgi:catechol 2,3-dioxygenase-like lactoylglutathione lyase family enzyme